MLTLATVYMIIVTCVILLLSFFLYRFLKTVLIFDELFAMLIEDIDTNITFFEKLDSIPVLSNSPEIMNASKNMHIMRIRLEEFLKRIEESTGRKVKRQKISRNPPVVA